MLTPVTQGLIKRRSPRLLLTCTMLVAGAAAALLPTVATGVVLYAAARTQPVVIGSAPGRDLEAAYAYWPFDLAAEMCTGHQADYAIKASGPQILEDGREGSSKAIVAILVRRRIRSGAEVNGVFTYCKFCTSKLGYLGDYNPSASLYAMVTYDSVNQRWGWQLGNQVVRIEPLAQTALKEGSTLWVGAEVDGLSELGPFLHDRASVFRTSTGVWTPFTPTDQSGQRIHRPPPEDRYFTWWDSNGSLGINTFLPESCS